MKDDEWTTTAGAYDSTEGTHFLWIGINTEQARVQELLVASTRVFPVSTDQPIKIWYFPMTNKII